MKKAHLLLTMLFAQTAFAAPAPITGPADASRLQREQRRVVVPKSITSQSPSDIKQGSTLAIPKNADQIKFNLKSVTIKGSTVYAKEALQDLYSGKIGQEIRLLDIYAIANEINQMYARDGYVFSKAVIPAQEIAGGNVVIQVTEGKIGSVKFEGAIEQTSLIKAHLDRIVTNKPANIHDLEREVLLMNDLPGVSVQTVLKPRAGGVLFDVVLVAKKESFENSFLLNNYGSRYIGPFLMSANLGVNHSLLLPHNQTSLNVLLPSETDEMRATTASHMIPLNSYGTKLLLEGSYSESEPGYRLLDSETKSTSTRLKAELTQPIVRQRFYNIYGSIGFDGEDSETNVAKSLLTKDQVRSLRIGASADYIDRFAGNNYLKVTYSKGLDVLDPSAKNNSNASRANGDPEYSKVYGVFSRIQSITSGFAVLGVVAGQYSYSNLLASEEFGYGGQTFGRAYDSSELLGDHGLNGLAELRYYGFSDYYGGFDFMPFAFYDVGKIWNINDGQEEDITAASAGGGLRVDHKRFGLASVFTVAKPLTAVRQNPPQSKSGRDPVYLFQVGFNF